MWTMCGVVYILLYYVLYQSSLWLPDFNKLLVLSSVTEPFTDHAHILCSHTAKGLYLPTWEANENVAVDYWIGSAACSLPDNQLNMAVCGGGCAPARCLLLIIMMMMMWRNTVSVLYRIKKSGKSEYLYSALHGTNHLKHSGMDHTAFNLQRTPYLPLPRKLSPDCASTECGGEHLIAAHYSFIDPRGWKAELNWLIDLQRTVYPHK